MHRRNNCERVISRSTQSISTDWSMAVGSRNATNRSDRSPRTTFNCYRYAGFAAHRRSFQNLDRVAVAHIAQTTAGLGEDHPCLDTAKQRYCNRLHLLLSRLVLLATRGSDENASLPYRLGPAINLWFCYLGATYPLILSIFPFFTLSYYFIRFNFPNSVIRRVPSSNSFTGVVIPIYTYRALTTILPAKSVVEILIQ